MIPARTRRFLLPMWILIAAPLWGGDWPGWRGPDRDGKAVEPKLKMNWNQQPPRHAWTISGMGGGYASVSIVGEKLYSTGNFPSGQAVVCIDLATRERAWMTPLTSRNPDHSYPGSRSTPTVDGDRLYVVASDGQIACLDRDSGEILWRRNFRDWGGRMMSGWGYAESPLVDGDFVLCTPGGPDAMIVALRKNSGEEVWRTKLPAGGERGKDGAGYSSIVISNAGGVKQYVQLVGRGLIGVKADDGALLWGYDKIANQTANIPTPLVSGDYIFASTGYQTGACLLRITKTRNGIKPEEVYFLDAKTFQNHHGGMILQGEFIYAGHQHNRGFPICLHMPKGTVRWGGDFRPPGSGSAAVLAVNEQLIFRYQDGTLALISANPKKYELLGTMTPDYQEKESWSHPVVVNRKLYLREQDKLMCYDLLDG